MTHKERLLTAINHEEPDRVPIGSTWTPEAEKKVFRHLGLESGKVKEYKVGDPSGLATGAPFPIVMDHDYFLPFVGPFTGFSMVPDREYTDEWGIGRKWIANPAGGELTEIVLHPLAGIRDPAEFTIPDFSRPDRYDHIRKLIDEHGDEYGIIAGCACTLFELSWFLRGMERMMCDLVENKDFAHAFLDKLLVWVDTAGRECVKLGADIIYVGDDFGMQDRMLMSPKTFREFFKPRYAKLFAAWKAINPDVKIAFHSCGYIYPIIGDLIEIGVDILNPIQPKCMDPVQVKKGFGDHLTLWGTVDTQETLPFGTPEDVANEVRLRLRTVGVGGGLILAPAHRIQPDVPIENIMAFYNTAKEYGCYPIRC